MPRAQDFESASDGLKSIFTAYEKLAGGRIVVGGVEGGPDSCLVVSLELLMGHKTMLAREISILQSYEQYNGQVRSKLYTSLLSLLTRRLPTASLGTTQGQERVLREEERTIALTIMHYALSHSPFSSAIGTSSRKLRSTPVCIARKRASRAADSCALKAFLRRCG